MDYLLLVLIALHSIFSLVKCETCKDDCPKDGNMTCALNVKEKKYIMFPSECSYEAYIGCHSVELVQTPLKFCIKSLKTSLRRLYGDSCPLFCPNHYRPVCGMSNIRSYIYKTFTNGCYFDMLNCRGDELSEYTEVPMSFCQRHAMKNMFKEQVVITGLDDYRDYHEY